MTEWVEPVDLGVIWDPNAPQSVLLAYDSGRTVLALHPHPDDPDRRCAMIIWTGTHSATLSDPNDEAISEHRLYDRGLKDALWAGRVHGSRAIRDLAQMRWSGPHRDSPPVGGLVHHVLPLKEAVVEVIAQSFTIARAGDTTAEAAITTLKASYSRQPT